MKVSVYLKKSSSSTSSICFRVREKNVDIKVVSPLVVHDKYWDSDTLSYKRTTAVPAVEQKLLPEQIASIIEKVEKTFSDKANSAWLKQTIEDVLHPARAFERNHPNLICRIHEYLEKFDRLMAVTDLFLLDIKEINDEKHKDLTGWTNKNILDLAKYLSDHDKDMWIRHVLVPGVTDAQEDLEQLGDFVAGLKTVKRFEVLPYHTLGVFKWEELGIPYTLSDVMPPDKEQIARANDILRTAEYTGYLEK